MVKSKDPIRLRRRKTPTGLVSLYLDIYIDGKRSYEYLKMYLVPEKGKAERDKNRETLALALDFGEVSAEATDLNGHAVKIAVAKAEP